MLLFLFVLYQKGAVAFFGWVKRMQCEGVGIRYLPSFLHPYLLNIHHTTVIAAPVLLFGAVCVTYANSAAAASC